MPLRIVTPDPLNAEATLAAAGAPLTPTGEFYIRDNFAIPELDAASWRLRVSGRVASPLDVDLGALRALPALTRRVTLECAGNGRAFIGAPVPGTPWGLGAAGTASFTGVALRDVLRAARPLDDALEVLFTGADGGPVEGWGEIRFQRSLPVATALGEGPLLAWAMNGAPLEPAHGYPVRLVVPGYYAVASVKWLVAIDVVAEPFLGHFQADRYMYRGDGLPARPVSHMRVRALLTSHADGERVRAGTVELAGAAWSGTAAIAAVEVQVDDGAWLPAELIDAGAPGLRARWRYLVALEAGMRTVSARARDDAGEVQPERPPWNELGYGNNVIQRVRLEVR